MTALLEFNTQETQLHETGTTIAVPVFPIRYRLHSLCSVILLCISFLTSPTAYAAEAAVSMARQVELTSLVRNDCGSCHGLYLNGGLGPALTPQALVDKPNDVLVATVLHGRPGTPMPPWQSFLTETEAEWIIENLKQGFPNAQPN